MPVRKKRILCVDDEAINLKLLASVLATQGYEAVLSYDPQDALKKLENEDIDMALLDVMMPDMTGYDLCRWIKGNERLRNIPVVMITALTSKDERIKGIEAGAEDFISKPIYKVEVLARIKMLLRMKELNDRLNYSYLDMTSLTSFGENIIHNFNAAEFDFLSTIDSIVDTIIRHNETVKYRPELFIAAIPDNEEATRWSWYRYSSKEGRVQRDRIEGDFHKALPLPAKGSFSKVFLNSQEIPCSDFEAFCEMLELISIKPVNMVSYLSANFCLFALNYGREVTSYDSSVLNSFVMQCLFLRHLSTQVQKTDEAFTYAVYALARASEVNDDDTGNHIMRVGEFTATLAKKMGLSERFVKRIRLQSTLHDVGKIHTPADILKKPGKLTPEEWEEMKQHTYYGVKIIGSHPQFEMAAAIALTHHEKWDGSGYPRGIKGEDIPVEGRITSIADQYDALRNPRVYKKAFDHETTFRIITEGDGRTIPQHFDPLVLKAFKESSFEFEEVYARITG